MPWWSIAGLFAVPMVTAVIIITTPSPPPQAVSMNEFPRHADSTDGTQLTASARAKKLEP